MKYKFKHLILPLSLSVALLLNSGCGQSASVIAGNSLTAIGQTENSAMIAAAKAEVAGTISTNTWNDIANKHALFLISYDAAVSLAATGAAIAPANVTNLAASVTNAVNSAITSSK